MKETIPPSRRLLALVTEHVHDSALLIIPTHEAVLL